MQMNNQFSIAPQKQSLKGYTPIQADFENGDKQLYQNQMLKAVTNQNSMEVSRNNINLSNNHFLQNRPADIAQHQATIEDYYNVSINKIAKSAS